MSIVLQRPATSGLHRLQTILAKAKGDARYDAAAGIYDAIPFLCEHNWAAIFSPEHCDLGVGEWPLPFRKTVFEFRMSGAHAIAVVSWIEGAKNGLFKLAIENRDGSWTLSRGYAVVGNSIFGITTDEDRASILGGAFGVDGPNKQFDPLWNNVEIAHANALAMCVALDAGVLRSSVIEPPARLNAKRAGRGRKPLSAYHIVRLLDQYAGEGARTGDRPSPRFHFVRGHRRPSSGRWIESYARGKIELGSIEKEYRL